jgi:hypothetical protein
MPLGDASYKAPHRAFVETFRVEAGTADEDVLVGDEGELDFEDVDNLVEPDELAALEHVPYDN